MKLLSGLMVLIHHIEMKTLPYEEEEGENEGDEGWGDEKKEGKDVDDTAYFLL